MDSAQANGRLEEWIANSTAGINSSGAFTTICAHGRRVPIGWMVRYLEMPVEPCGSLVNSVGDG